MAQYTPKTWTTGETITAAELNAIEQAAAAAQTATDAAAASTADRARANHTGTQSADTITDGTTNKAYTATEKTKLAGVATGATANVVGAAGSGATNALSANDPTTTNSRTPTAHTHPASDLTATGTRDATTFLRGDNTWATPAGGGGSSSSTLTPTATKTAAYTAAVGDLAVMNVAGGATTLTLPTAPADKSTVGFLAVGATTATPLIVNRGGTDTLGTSAATSVTVPLANEVTTYQYDAANTRWLAVSNVKPLTALDARFLKTSDVSTAGTSTGDALRAAFGSPRAPYLGPVATRGRIPSGVTASSIYKQMMTWSRHVATDNITALSLLYSTINGIGEVAVSCGPGQVTASVEYPMGTYTQVTFGGTATGTLPTNDHMVSDLTTLAAKIPAGATFWVGTWVNWTGTNSAVMMDALYTSLPAATTRENVQASTTSAADTTMTGVRNSGATNARDSYRPTAILGMTSQPTFLLTGDSRTRAALAWEQNADSYGFQGLSENVLGGRYGYINVGVGTDTYTNALSATGNNYVKRGALQTYCTHVLDDFGINSVWADSSATHQANVTAFRAKFPTKPYFKTTLIPQLTATSTQIAPDGSDQTPQGTLTNFVTNNNWVRQGGGGAIDGYIDLEDLVTLKRDSAKFLPAERVISDAAMTSGSNILTSATANFTTSDLGKGIQVKGAGASGANLNAFIKAVTNATTVTLGQLIQTGAALNASTTVSAAQAGIGVLSMDNTHQSIRLEALIRTSTAARALSMVK